MAIHNKSHSNHALMALNKSRKDRTLKYKTAKDFDTPDNVKISLNIMDCTEFLNYYQTSLFN